MKMKKRLLSILLSLALILGLVPGMSLTAYAAEYTSLQQGDVLHLGDTINSTTEYKTADANLNPNNNPYTLVRGNIAARTITESDTGAYYLLKINSDSMYIGAIRKSGKYQGGYWPVTDTSDGIYVESLNGSNVTFAVHVAPAHTHSFTYAAGTGDNANKITATCNGEGTCDITEGLTLTISAPEGTLTADGTTTFPATLSTGYNTTAFPEGSISEISYTKDGEPFTGTPTEAGTYTASVTVGEGQGAATASVSYTVNAAAQDLADAKTTATNTVNGVNANDYITADQDTVANAKTTALAAINAATTEDEVTAAMTTFNNAIAACTTQAAQDLADAKTTATNTVNGVNANDYIEADRQTVTNAKTTALNAINTATTEAEVTTALTNFNNAIAGCTTQAAADLATAKTNATATVNGVDANDYIEADRQTVTNAKTTALNAINTATTEAEVTAALNTFNNTIAGCTTQTAADLTTAKTNATNTVNAVNADDYISADQETVTNAKNTALAAINAATMEAEVTAALNTFNTAIAGCIKKADYIDESGVNQNHRLHEGNLIFTFKRTQDDQNTFSLFGKALVDNNELTLNVDYTKASGSLILTLKAAYLDTLALGEHTLTVLFTDGRADSRFTVSRALDPTNFDDVAVPSDSFTFKVVWQGGTDKDIDFTLYRKGGTVYRHGFDKQKLGSGEWQYSAWFSSPEACYVLETPMKGYRIRYENTGVYAQVTDRCCDGGTITIHKVPKTGDTANLALWMNMVVIGALTLCGVAVLGKRRKHSRN